MKKLKAAKKTVAHRKGIAKVKPKTCECCGRAPCACVQPTRCKM